MAINGVKLEEIVDSLNIDERMVLYNLLASRMKSGSHVRVIGEVQDLKHKSGFTCPHCQNSAIRFGTFVAKNGEKRQRYKCKACNKTFNDLTATPLHRTRDKRLWIPFIKLMIEGYSLRKCSERLEVPHVRLFYWRHKILAALKHIQISKFDGIVEVDETYVPFSRKGERNVPKPRKRGHSVRTRGISHEQVCILVARDRVKKTFSKAVSRGRILTSSLEEHLGGKISSENVLCTDAWRAFTTFAKTRGLEHYRFHSNGKRVKGIYHIQNVNSYHSRWKKWLDRFNGVASKYLDHYLAWFQYLEQHGINPTTENIKNLIISACMSAMNETNRSLHQTEFLAA